MSPHDTRHIGDLDDLPEQAPAWLKSLFAVGEGVIHEQVELLGQGKPSQAPDLREILRNQGVEQPENQSEMIDRYNNKQDDVTSLRSTYVAQDDGIPVTTAGVGEAVTNAYDAVDTAVKNLNEQIEDAHGTEITQTDTHGNEYETLPTAIVDGLLSGLWDTLDKTYEQVSGVSDQAAAEALGIEDSTRTYTDSPYGGNSPTPYFSPSYPTADTGGSTDSVIPTSGSMGTAIVSSGDKPTAFAMMEYLIKEHGFTPAQAAGIVANAKFESSFDVEAKGDYDENTGQYTAHGLFQWRFDRHQGLLDFANQPGEDLGDWRTHIDYMVQELNGGGYNEAASVVNNDNSSAATVAATFDSEYERSSGHTTGERQSYANDLLTKWNEAGGNTTSRPSTDTGLMV